MNDAPNLITFKINGHPHSFDPSSGISLAFPLDFGGTQPNAYGVAPAKSEAYEAGTLVGDTRRGGSCNFEEYRLIPHCNGTHTECVGHITNERISIDDCLRDAFVPALVVSVKPVPWYVDSSDAYPTVSDSSDVRITRHILETAIAEFDVPENGALVVRTLPNLASKRSLKYVDFIPPYFTSDAMRFIVGLGLRHLICDLPSIDRLFDEGKLLNHRIFWDVDEESYETKSTTRRGATITELAFVPDEVKDGIYALSIQIPPFASDAAPSRPLLFKV